MANVLPDSTIASHIRRTIHIKAPKIVVALLRRTCPLVPPLCKGYMISRTIQEGIMNNDLSFIHHQLQVNSLEELFGPSLLPSYGSLDLPQTNDQGLISCKRSALQADLHHTLVEKPCKQLKTDSWNSYDQINNHILNSQEYHDSSSTMLSFSNSSNCSSQTSSLVTPKEEAAVSNVTFTSHHHEMVVNQASFDRQSCVLESRPQVAKKSTKFASIPQQSMDHIIAERKRREKLSQRFIALSATIPGLKKMDKASVLADAIKYVKQMQERGKTLEEEAKKNSRISSLCEKILCYCRRQ